MKPETRVGILFLVSFVLIVLFSYVLGAFNPFSNTHSLYVAYNFAGGIEIGSPVRVMGIKVGKVEEIKFEPTLKDKEGKEVKLKIKISIDKSAWDTIREDSKFFINLAGIIGEKFLEISPGSLDKSTLKPGDMVRGEDPPRIDQLISQSYGLAGKVLEFVERNEGSVTNTIKALDQLLVNFNKTIAMIDKTSKNAEVAQVMRNLVQISGDLAYLTAKIRTEDGQKTLDLIHKLIWRLEGLDKPAIKKFFQEEGIRARMF